MTAYVDDVRHRFGRMVMCHMWADTLDELLSMADRIGVDRKWLQRPEGTVDANGRPLRGMGASWVHFDICMSKKAKALAAGAVLTDKFGPVEHEAKRTGNAEMLKNVELCRARRSQPPKVVMYREAKTGDEAAEFLADPHGHFAREK